MDKDGNECEEWMNARSFDINVVYHWYVGHSWADQNFFNNLNQSDDNCYNCQIMAKSGESRI